MNLFMRGPARAGRPHPVLVIGRVDLFCCWYFLWGGDPRSEGYLGVAPHNKYQLECQIGSIGTFYGVATPRYPSLRGSPPHKKYQQQKRSTPPIKNTGWVRPARAGPLMNRFIQIHHVRHPWIDLDRTPPHD